MLQREAGALAGEDDAAACFCVAWAAEEDAGFWPAVVVVAAELAVGDAFEVLPLGVVVLVAALDAAVLVPAVAVGLALVV